MFPIKFEKIKVKNNTHFKEITFLAYPISGTAKIGYDPEADYTKDYKWEFLDIKWQSMYDVSDIDEKIKRKIKPIQEYIRSDKINKRVATIVYKKEKNKIKYLFVSAKKTPSFFLLPQGHIEKNETPKISAERETKEEAGVVCEIENEVSFQLSKINNKPYITYIFLAKFTIQRKSLENRKVKWLDIDEINNPKIYPETKKLLLELDEEL